MVNIPNPLNLQWYEHPSLLLQLAAPVEGARRPAGAQPVRAGRHAAGTARGRPARRRRAGPHGRRHLQRPGLPDDGLQGLGLRAQRADREDDRRPQATAHARSARHQQHPDGPRHVQAGRHPQRARRRLAAVREPQLVLPRRRPRRPRHRDPARGRRRLPREPDADPRTPSRCAARSSTGSRHRCSATPRRTGGTARRSTAAAPRSRTSSARSSTARSRSTTTAGCPRATSPASTSPGCMENYWVGPGLLHTLFAREHNTVCRRAQEGAPGARRPAALRARRPRRVGADRQDPHRRVDALRAAPPGAADRHERQLVRRARRDVQGQDRPDRGQRGAVRASSARRPTTTPRRSR